MIGMWLGFGGRALSLLVAHGGGSEGGSEAAAPRLVSLRRGKRAHAAAQRCPPAHPPYPHPPLPTHTHTHTPHPLPARRKREIYFIGRLEEDQTKPYNALPGELEGRAFPRFCPRFYSFSTPVFTVSIHFFCFAADFASLSCAVFRKVRRMPSSEIARPSREASLFDDSLSIIRCRSHCSIFQNRTGTKTSRRTWTRSTRWRSGSRCGKKLN